MYAHCAEFQDGRITLIAFCKLGDGLDMRTRYEMFLSEAGVQQGVWDSRGDFIHVFFFQPCGFSGVETVASTLKNHASDVRGGRIDTSGQRKH